MIVISSLAPPGGEKRNVFIFFKMTSRVGMDVFLPSNRIEEEIPPVYTPGKMPTGKNVTGKLYTTADSAIASSMNSTTSMNSTHMNSTIEQNLTRYK